MALWPVKKDSPEAPSKGSEIRKMVGHEGKIENAEAAAPASTVGSQSSIEDDGGTTVRRTTKKARNQVVTTLSQKDIQNAERDKARQEAMQKIAEEMAKDVASVPYEIWAFVAQDEELRLATDEEQQLAEAYALVAQSLPLGNMNPLITCGLFILSRNAKIVKKKLIEHKKKMDQEGVDEVESAKKAS